MKDKNEKTEMDNNQFFRLVHSVESIESSIFCQLFVNIKKRNSRAEITQIMADDHSFLNQILYYRNLHQIQDCTLQEVEHKVNLLGVW